MDEMKEIPYVAFEAAQARSERIIKRLIIALVVVTAMLFASNLFWLHEWTSFEYDITGETINIDGDDGGNANFIGNDGSINNG